MAIDKDLGVAASSNGSSSLIDELGGNAILFAMLIILLVVVPFLPSADPVHHPQSAISKIIWSGLIVAGILRTSGRPHFLWAALVIAVPSLLSRWVNIFGLGDAGSLVIALFFALIIAHILTDIFSQRRVTLDHILGGINVYLLLGVLFARLHVAVEKYNANAYMMGDSPLAVVAGRTGQHVEALLQYFSFTTLTTLGYGDIRPASEIARMLSTAEAVSGQLFLAILVARLVSVYASRRPQNPDTPNA
jgi:hypothetical protein